MKAIVSNRYGSLGASQPQEAALTVPKDSEREGAFAELKRAVYAALETYSNVHRGSGQSSLVSTHLYEQAREIVLEYLGLSKNQYTVIFCSPRRAEQIKGRLKPKSFQSLSSQDIGLPLGVRALAVNRKALPGGVPYFYKMASNSAG